MLVHTGHRQKPCMVVATTAMTQSNPRTAYAAQREPPTGGGTPGVPSGKERMLARRDACERRGELGHLHPLGHPLGHPQWTDADDNVTTI